MGKCRAPMREGTSKGSSCQSRSCFNRASSSSRDNVPHAIGTKQLRIFEKTNGHANGYSRNVFTNSSGTERESGQSGRIL